MSSNKKEKRSELELKLKLFSDKLDKANRKLEEYKKRSEENLAGWKRTKADFVNYRNNQKRYLEDFKKYANEDIIMKLLPTIDSFELSTRHLPDDLKDSDWAKGILCIKNQFDNFLKEVKVEKIKSIGEKFDPRLFESVGEEESDREEGVVVEEVQGGYKMFGKVIRPAKVKISKRIKKELGSI